MPTPTALITGGTTGIGRATAEVLHDRGFQVMITGSNPDTVAAARRQLPPEVVVLRADSRSLTDIDRVADEVRSRFGSLTAVFLNAGISRRTPLQSIDEATFDDLMAVNLKGQFFTLQKTAPLLADGASIVITVGVGAVQGVAGGSVTAASRGALLTMVPSLALELAPRRMRVNAVSPGVIDTPIWSKSGASPEALDQIMTETAARVPFRRFGTAREVADTVAFLLSDGATYVTGQHITVGGGIGLGT